MKVFLSHQRDDSTRAMKVAARLRYNGLDTYLDVVDDALRKDGPELSDYLRAQMSTCTQLMAVVSSSTKGSWWVPWEIGVASEKDFLIATYTSEYTELPSYLKKWPFLRTDQDIDEYARLSKTAAANIRKGYLYTREAVARSFHHDLKRVLRQ